MIFLLTIFFLQYSSYSILFYFLDKDFLPSFPSSSSEGKKNGTGFERDSCFKLFLCSMLAFFFYEHH